MAFLPGKHVEGGRNLRVVVIRYVFVLLLGLVFGFVLQSAGILVKAVDSFGQRSENGAFTAFANGGDYGR